MDIVKTLQMFYKDIIDHKSYYECSTKTSNTKKFFDKEGNEIKDIVLFKKQKIEGLKKKFVRDGDKILVFNVMGDIEKEIPFNNKSEAEKFLQNYHDFLENIEQNPSSNYFNNVDHYLKFLFGENLKKEGNGNYIIDGESKIEMASFLVHSGLLEYIQSLSTIKK